MANQVQTKKENNREFKHWHGIVQALIMLVTVGVLGFLGYAVFSKLLKIYDAILLGETFLTFAIAVICSHAYNYKPDPSSTNSLREEAAKLKAIWLHANFCWQAASAWMTITSLYCTCSIIYISGSTTGDPSDQVHILIYSIISLVLSLGIYVIRPSNRASGYRHAYLSVSTALTQLDTSSAEQDLKNAIIEGEKIIAQQDLFEAR